MADQLNEHIKSSATRKRNRNIALISYLFLSAIAVILLVIFIENPLIIIMVVIGDLLSLVILLYFLLNTIKGPINLPLQDEELETPRIVPLEYYGEQLMTGILRIVLPMIAIYTIASVVILITDGISGAVYFFVALAFFVSIALIFSKITIHISSGILTIRLGPFKDILRVDDVISIRSTKVKPMGTYLGYGKRTGVDGSIGYISGGKIGVRMIMRNGKNYVITVNDPQQLVNVIRYAKNQDYDL